MDMENVIFKLSKREARALPNMDNEIVILDASTDNVKVKKGAEEEAQVYSIPEEKIAKIKEIIAGTPSGISDLVLDVKFSMLAMDGYNQEIYMLDKQNSRKIKESFNNLDTWYCVNEPGNETPDQIKEKVSLFLKSLEDIKAILKEEGIKDFQWC